MYTIRRSHIRDGRHGPGWRYERVHHEHRDGRGHGREEKRRFHEEAEPQLRSAQTFRRGKAIAFLERMQIKRETLQRQLSQAEFEAIKPVISGELKAVDELIQEFIHLFGLHEMKDGTDGFDEQA